MPRRLSRLDAELVRRRLARSREHASALIGDGRVEVGGVVVSKPASVVTGDASIRVRSEASDPGYASRGAHKLAGALERFPDIEVAGARCLDAGASTGGFTDVLLRAGAKQVVAVDVGYGQLAWSLRSNQRVEVLDRTNIRTVSPEMVGGAVDLVVADLSFISLPIVLPALAECTKSTGNILPMVKPQFEVGRERLGAGGVVRDPQQRAQAVINVARVARDLGWPAQGVCRSPLPGPAGNVEFFLWLRHGRSAGISDQEILVEVAGSEEGQL